MDRMGLARDKEQRQRVAAIGCGELAARTVEPGTPITLAQVSADNLLWLFVFDDTYCDEGPSGRDPAAMSLLVARLIRLAETGQAPPQPSPHENALLDLRLRITRSATPCQLVRWIDALRSYLTYQVWEASHRAQGSVPSTDEYLSARIANGSMPVCCALLDVTCGFEVPAERISDPWVRALTEMCCALVGFDNDILSHWKETLRCGDGINLIDVLATEHNLPPHAVLPDAIALRDCILHRYLQLRTNTAGRLSPSGQRYLNLLDHWIRGNLDWALTSGRYLNPDNPTRLPDTVTDTTSSQPDGPPPYPGIAWWWTADASTGEWASR